MTMPTEPARHRSHPTYRLTSGWHLVETWAATARKSTKYAGHRALFAIAEGSAGQRYPIVDDVHDPRDFSVWVTQDLVITVRIFHTDTFGVLHIGPPATAPGVPG